MEPAKTISVPWRHAFGMLGDWARLIEETGRRSDRTKVDELFILERLFDYDGNSVVDVTFPLEVELSEKPDFVFRFDGKSVGVEVTKFQAEQRGRADDIIEKLHRGKPQSPTDPIAIYSVGSLGFDSPKRTNEELMAEMLPRQAGLTQGMRLPQAYKTYASALCKIISAKAGKVTGDGLPTGSDLWLVVEDWMHLSDLALSQVLPDVLQFIDAPANAVSFKTILFSRTFDRDVIRIR